MQLSVLDLVPVRSDQTTGNALAATRRLAQVAEEAGYHRYWLAEHHNMPAVAATNPPLLIAMVAAATERIRVGSGGVMLPNHAPLVVAEQFALLEAAYPGRIDLGIGRAPGTDPVTSFALRHGAGGVEDDAVARFPSYVDNVVSMMSPGGVGLQVQGRMHPLNATPHAVSTPPVWLLGSSDYSARLAAERGLPYVFAHHFSGEGTAAALDLYRSQFRPSEALAEPRTFLTVNAAVAETQEEADRLALPQLEAMVALRTGGQLRAQRLVEEAEKDPVPDAHVGLLEAMRRRWVLGTPDSAAAGDRRPGLVVRRGRGDGPPGGRRLHRHPSRHLPRPGDHPPPPGHRPRLTRRLAEASHLAAKTCRGVASYGDNAPSRSQDARLTRSTSGRRLRSSASGGFVAHERQHVLRARRPDVARELDPLLAVPVADQLVDREHMGVEELRRQGAGSYGGEAEDAAADRAGELLQRGHGQANLLRPPDPAPGPTPALQSATASRYSVSARSRSAVRASVAATPGPSSASSIGSTLVRTRTRVNSWSLLCGSVQNSMPSVRQAVSVSARVRSSSGRR